VVNIRCLTIEGDFSITQKKKKLFAHCVTNEQCLSFCITLTLVSSQVRTEGNERGLAQCTTLHVRVLKLMEQDLWTSKGETQYLRSRDLQNNATYRVHNFMDHKHVYCLTSSNMLHDSLSFFEIPFYYCKREKRNNKSTFTQCG